MYRVWRIHPFEQIEVPLGCPWQVVNVIIQTQQGSPAIVGFFTFVLFHSVLVWTSFWLRHLLWLEQICGSIIVDLSYMRWYGNPVAAIHQGLGTEPSWNQRNSTFDRVSRIQYSRTKESLSLTAWAVLWVPLTEREYVLTLWLRHALEVEQWTVSADCVWTGTWAIAC
jgi:hypothetical protein